MKLLDISPNFLNEELARKICRNKDLKRLYIRKYDLSGGSNDKYNIPQQHIKAYIKGFDTEDYEYIKSLDQEEYNFVLRYIKFGEPDEKFKQIRLKIDGFLYKQQQHIEDYIKDLDTEDY